MSIPIRYIPKRLSPTDSVKQRNSIKQSRQMYTRKKYYLRPHVKSFVSKPSNHVSNAKRIYKVNNVKPSYGLVRKTGCSLRTLEKIVNKGRGAYYSSGSRPNQTPDSWGYARLASAVTGGKSSVIDYHLLKKGCKKTSKALRLATRVKRNNKTNKRKKQ
jgi:hypothetical protein